MLRNGVVALIYRHALRQRHPLNLADTSLRRATIFLTHLFYFITLLHVYFLSCKEYVSPMCVSIDVLMHFCMD